MSKVRLRRAHFKRVRSEGRVMLELKETLRDLYSYGLVSLESLQLLPGALHSPTLPDTSVMTNKEEVYDQPSS